MNAEKYVLPSILEAPVEPIGGKRYIYDQIMAWILIKKQLSFAGMTNVSKAIRLSLERDYSLNTLTTEDVRRDNDGTVKFLFALHSKLPMARVESVFIPSKTHCTACLSTQAGCPVGCIFCATGAAGPGRNLDFSEMVLQLLNMEAELAKEISHVVFMGMGEPLLNYRQTTKAVRLMEENKLHIGARRITISTIGIPGKICQLVDDGIRVELAVSLHSAIESKRRKIIPYGALAPLPELMAACDYYYGKTKRLPTFEYVLVKTLNDGRSDLNALAELLNTRHCKVNIIGMNGSVNGCQSPDRNEVHDFCRALREKGIKATVRRSVGRTIQAACGQLRAERSIVAPSEQQTRNTAYVETCQ